MNKEFYNKHIKEYIRNLIEEKDKIAEDISINATYIDFNSKTTNLSQFDINEINKMRNNISTIYQLIEDLNELMKKEV